MTDGHLPPDTVADHLEGLLDPAERDRADAHLRDCAACAQLRDDLESIHDLLGASGARTIPVPEAVDDRIRAAIETEAAIRSRSGGAASLASARRRRWSRRANRTLAAAAGLVVLAGAGAFAVQQLSEPGSSAVADRQGGNNAAGGNGPDSASPSHPAGGRPDLNAASFAGAARAAVAGQEASPTTGTPSQGPTVKGFQGQHGFAGDPTSRCVTDAISRAAPGGSARQVAVTKPARWHELPVVLAVADIRDSAGKGRTARAYAVAGCPDAPRIVHQEQIRLPASR